MRIGPRGVDAPCRNDWCSKDSLQQEPCTTPCSLDGCTLCDEIWSLPEVCTLGQPGVLQYLRQLDARNGLRARPHRQCKIRCNVAAEHLEKKFLQDLAVLQCSMWSVSWCCKAFSASSRALSCTSNLRKIRVCHGSQCGKMDDQASHFHNSQQTEMNLKGKKTPSGSNRTVLDAAAPFSWRLCTAAGFPPHIIKKTENS